MKRFLCQIFVFLLLIIAVCSIPLLHYEKKAKETTKPPYAKINEVERLKHVDANMIVLGNSRAEANYDDSLMSLLTGKKCLNLGWDGHSFDFAYHVIYTTYLKQNKKPDYIIVDVSPSSFFVHVQPLYVLQMLPYLNKPEFQFYIDICPQLSESDKLLFVRYFGKLSKVCKEMHSFNHPETWSVKPKIKRWDKSFFTKPEKKVKCNKTIVQVFRTFLDECYEENINVILVCSPMHVEDGLNYFDIEGFWKVVKKCASGKEIPIVTYQDFFDSDTTYFSDPIHLNKYGREVFTTKLIHDLDSVGIIK